MRTAAIWGLLPLFLWAGSLPDLIDAAQKGDSAQAGEWGVKAAESAYAAAKRGFLPTVDVGARFSEVDEVSMEPVSALSATLGWVFFDGFAREYETGARKHELAASRLEQRDRLNQSALETVRFYFMLIATDKTIEAGRVQIKQLEAEYARLSGYEQARIVSAAESSRIAAALEAARYELSSLEVERMRLKLALEALTDLNLENFAPQEATVGEPAADQKADRPDIEAQRLRIRAQSNRVEQVRSAYLPQISLEDVFSKNRYDDNVESFGLPEDQNRISLTLSLRLIDFNRLGKEREAALASKRAEESRLSAAQKNAQNEQKLSDYRVKSAGPKSPPPSVPTKAA